MNDNLLTLLRGLLSVVIGNSAMSVPTKITMFEVEVYIIYLLQELNKGENIDPNTIPSLPTLADWTLASTKLLTELSGTADSPDMKKLIADLEDDIVAIKNDSQDLALFENFMENLDD